MYNWFVTMVRLSAPATDGRRLGPAWKDTVFVKNKGAEGEGLCGLLVARVYLLFLFPYKLKKYRCTLVEWFLLVADEPDDVTGMWIVAPEEDQQGHRVHAVIGLDMIL